MTITLIILLILVGLFLLWLEFFIVPGISIAGIGGCIMILGAIFFAYTNQGTNVGHIVLVFSIVTLAILLYLSFNSNTWNKTALKTNIDAKIEGINKDKISIGDEGVCISRLAPMGKIMVNGEMIEAKSKLGYINEKEKVKILEIYNTNVLVIQINEV